MDFFFNVKFVKRLTREATYHLILLISRRPHSEDAVHQSNYLISVLTIFF